MGAVRNPQDMIAAMSPALDTQVWHFCTTDAAVPFADQALARFEEDEGTTLILSEAVARRHGFDTELPMARITLQVHSALDGVGLTAAVAGVLAQAGIACNMVAAFHHDHVFVPCAQREQALHLLQDLASRGQR